MRGERLKDLRERENITQKDLADRIGIVGEQQILRYEKGSQEPKADVVVKLAEFFNVSTDYLLGISDDPDSTFREHLENKEARVISAWRRGERMEAIKMIAGDE